MEKKKFKLIAEYPECVILRKKMDKGFYKIQLRDCEGDVIRMCIKQGEAIPDDILETARTYSLAEIRKIKMEEELKWRREFVEA